jgi:maleate isomerase
MDIEYSFDDIAPGGRIGLVALATDYNSETDLRRILPEGVDLFTNRVMNANPVTIENLRGMSGDITRAASGLLPGCGVDVVIYGCTSGTAAIGGEELQRLIQVAQPGVPSTNPILAASKALRAVNARNISILTPYTDDVNVAIKDSFDAEGFHILNIDGFGLEDDIVMTGLPLSAIADAAVQICDPDADALFISCTAIRSALVVEELEQKLGKPVITSNQALIWHSLKLMNNSSEVKGFGQLFDHELANT